MNKTDEIEFRARLTAEGWIIERHIWARVKTGYDTEETAEAEARRLEGEAKDVG